MRVRNDYCKNAMAKACLELIKDKTINKITIDEITQKAGVGRATWFRTFKNRHDAIVYGLVLLWDEWAKEHNLKNHKKISVENAESFIDYVYEIRDIRSDLIRSGEQSAILDSFLYVLVRNNDPNDTKDYFMRMFVTYGITGLIEGWSNNHYLQSKEELSRYLKDLITQSLYLLK